MAIMPFLAMTEAEIRKNSVLPPKIAWMACHFSPYGLGLSNLPRELPPGSLLIMDDITPPRGHDPTLIAHQLAACVENLHCCGVLLDFQRDDCEEARTIAEYLVKALPCPVGVSECWAQDLDCAVFLPLLPPSAPLEEYFLPWKGREVWLELGAAVEIITLTEKGAETEQFYPRDLPEDGFSDEMLHCHYRIEEIPGAVRFLLWRTVEDVQALMEEAESFGITHAVGLWQEWHTLWGEC